MGSIDGCHQFPPPADSDAAVNYIGKDGVWRASISCAGSQPAGNNGCPLEGAEPSGTGPHPQDHLAVDEYFPYLSPSDAGLADTDTLSGHHGIPCCIDACSQPACGRKCQAEDNQQADKFLQLQNPPFYPTAAIYS
jgi:hypothetical protein